MILPYTLYQSDQSCLYPQPNQPTIPPSSFPKKWIHRKEPNDSGFLTNYKSQSGVRKQSQCLTFINIYFYWQGRTKSSHLHISTRYETRTLHSSLSFVSYLNWFSALAIRSQDYRPPPYNLECCLNWKQWKKVR